MEYRHGAALALGMLIGSLGCAHHSSMSLGTSSESVTATAPKVGEKEKRQPLPSTCIAFGTFSEQAAADPRRSPAEQQLLRDQARKAYQQALKIDPNEPSALLALARLYNSMDDHEHAVLTY